MWMRYQQRSALAQGDSSCRAPQGEAHSTEFGDNRIGYGETAAQLPCSSPLEQTSRVDSDRRFATGEENTLPIMTSLNSSTHLNKHPAFSTILPQRSSRSGG